MFQYRGGGSVKKGWNYSLCNFDICLALFLFSCSIGKGFNILFYNTWMPAFDLVGIHILCTWANIYILECFVSWIYIVYIMHGVVKIKSLFMNFQKWFHFLNDCIFSETCFYDLSVWFLFLICQACYWWP